MSEGDSKDPMSAKDSDSKEPIRGQGLIRGRSVSMERRSEDEDASSDSERLPDSLDDQGIPDSGVGSSSEKTSTVIFLILTSLFFPISVLYLSPYLFIPFCLSFTIYLHSCLSYYSFPRVLSFFLRLD